MNSYKARRKGIQELLQIYVGGLAQVGFQLGGGCIKRRWDGNLF